MSPEVFKMLNEHVDVSRETFDRLTTYHDELLKWQERVNLISPDTIPDIWTRHFLDSLQIVKYLPEDKGPIIDLGSGAGFPGLVVAIATERMVHLIESDMRKSIFLREAGRLTQAPVTVHNCRIESQPLDEAGIILSRACSSLGDLLHLVENFVSRETLCLFHKGKNYVMELEQAGEIWQFDQEIYPSVTDTNGVIVQLTNIARKE